MQSLDDKLAFVNWLEKIQFGNDRPLWAWKAELATALQSIPESDTLSKHLDAIAIPPGNNETEAEREAPHEFEQARFKLHQVAQTALRMATAMPISALGDAVEARINLAADNALFGRLKFLLTSILWALGLSGTVGTGIVGYFVIQIYTVEQRAEAKINAVAQRAEAKINQDTAKLQALLKQASIAVDQINHSRDTAKTSAMAANVSAMAAQADAKKSQAALKTLNDNRDVATSGTNAAAEKFRIAVKTTNVTLQQTNDTLKKTNDTLKITNDTIKTTNDNTAAIISARKVTGKSVVAPTNRKKETRPRSRSRPVRHIRQTLHRHHQGKSSRPRVTGKPVAPQSSVQPNLPNRE
jgi:hypothetical protein